MKKIAVVTDSNSGITQTEAVEMGVYVIPMPFTIDGENYFEGINLTQEQFFDKLSRMEDIVTSQPSPGSVMDTWDEALKENDEVVYIPMSSGLSGSMQTARTLADEDYSNKVFVVDNKRISVTQKQSVYDALRLIKEGKSAEEIKHILEDDAYNASIYICVPNLEYLKRGGRLTPAVASIGTLLKIKPVLQIQGDKLDSFALARTSGHARTSMINAVKADMSKRFSDYKDFYLYVAYTDNHSEADAFVAEIEEKMPGLKVSMCNPLSLSIACHIGTGALGIGIAGKLR